MHNTERATPDPKAGGQRHRSDHDAGKPASGAGGWLDRLGVALVVALVLLISGAMTSFAAGHASSATGAILAQAGDCPTGGGLNNLGKISCHVDQGLTNVDTLSSKMTNINSISPKIVCGLNGTSCSTSTTTTTTPPTTTTTTTAPPTTTTPTTTATTTAPPTTSAPPSVVTTTPPTVVVTTPPTVVTTTPPSVVTTTPPTTPLVVTTASSTPVVPTAPATPNVVPPAPPSVAVIVTAANNAPGAAARTPVGVALPTGPTAPASPISFVQPASFPNTGAGGMATDSPWPLALLLFIAMVSLGGVQRRHPTR